jgi:hypothetical protein
MLSHDLPHNTVHSTEGHDVQLGPHSSTNDNPSSLASRQLTRGATATLASYGARATRGAGTGLSNPLPVAGPR